jgi:hypothetical protein
MRFLLPLLLLSAASPALAGPGDEPDVSDLRAARVEQRQQVREERVDRPQPRFERPAREPVVRIEQPRAPEVRVDRLDRRVDGSGTADGSAVQRWRDRRPDRPRPLPDTTGAPVTGRGDSVADWRRGDRRRGERPTATPPNPAVQIDGATYTDRRVRDGGRWRDRDRDGRRDGDRWRDRDGRRDADRWSGRDGGVGRDDWRDRRADTGNWRRDWRRDPRYDWQRYRDRNRSIFRIGLYVDPFGWGYRPISYGWQLQPNYFAERYWISNPAYYSLPTVGWPYRWVRYYDDALLVDTRDGRVVDVINAFFW